jgi:hypothetical protein
VKSFHTLTRVSEWEVDFPFGDTSKWALAPHFAAKAAGRLAAPAAVAAERPARLCDVVISFRSGRGRIRVRLEA